MTRHESAALLARAGAALYGEHWQSPLARDLGVLLRTMQRWAAGQNPVNPNVWADVSRLLSERGAEIAKVKRLLPTV